jgi:hypothetical protein
VKADSEAGHTAVVKGFDWVELKAVKWDVHWAHSQAVRWVAVKVCMLVVK